MVQKDALTILLTGRAEGAFANLIQRICTSKKLVFDIYALKPLVNPDNQTPSSTMVFKQQFLTTLIRTYTTAEELRLYEDRPPHVKMFRNYFLDFNNNMKANSIPRGTINAIVIEVTDLPGVLDPVAETAAVQSLVNSHNEIVRDGKSTHRVKATKLIKKVLYTAYQVKSAQDSARLAALVNTPTTAKRLANSILITTYPADFATLQKAGGLGKTIKFKVAAIGMIKDRIWVAEVNSIGPKAFTTLPRLQVVLALNRGAKPSDARTIKEWHPLDSDLQFEAVVSEVFRLSLEEEKPLSAVPIQNSSMVPQKRRADHFGASQGQNNSPSNANVSAASRGNGSRGRPQRTRGEARGGGRRGGAQQQNTRGGYTQRGATPRGGNNARGRGARGNRDASNRRGGYKDHDAAQGSAKAGNENNMHNDY
jgi:hypothetical protein